MATSGNENVDKSLYSAHKIILMPYSYWRETPISYWRKAPIDISGTNGTTPKQYRYRKDEPPLEKFLIIGIIALLIGYQIGLLKQPDVIEKEVEKIVERQVPLPTIYSTARTLLPAVDNEGNGVVTPLDVEIKTGTGRTLTNIDRLLFWVDTQQSIQIARNVAESMTNISTKNYDIIYAIEAGNATIVGGPSAGAALTLTTIAALQNKTVRSDVMITGTINPDGTIGRVGGVLEKASAAKDVGATIFLVPRGEGTEVKVTPEEKCTNENGFVFCETEYKRQEVNIGNALNITVLEVSKVEDALPYFIS